MLTAHLNAALAGLALFCFAGCNHSPSEASLIGTWQTKRDQFTCDLTVTREHVASLSIYAKDVVSAPPMTGTWRLEGDDLMLALDKDNGPLRAPVRKITRDTLVIEMADGVWTCRRK
jgi:hypothetical protein